MASKDRRPSQRLGKSNPRRMKIITWTVALVTCAVGGQIVQMKATQRIDDEADAMSKMSSEYDLERAKLDASKAEVISAIEGEKNRIMVGVSDGQLQQVKASINAHKVGHEADLGR